MNKEETIKAAKIMLAWAEDGAEIEYKSSVVKWKVVKTPSWDLINLIYRIAEKKPLDMALDGIEKYKRDCGGSIERFLTAIELLIKEAIENQKLEK